MSSVASQATGKLAEFQSVVTEFQAAAAGKYSGPSTPFHFLQDKILSVDGLNTRELVANVEAAVGPTTVEARGGRKGGKGTGKGGVGILGALVLDTLGNALGSVFGDGIKNFFDKLRGDDEEDDAQCSSRRRLETVR